MIKSAIQPEETSNLCRSGDLSRMLPSEAMLIASGWPKIQHQNINEIRSKNARLLHLVRRAERNLMSYERSGNYLIKLHK